MDDDTQQLLFNDVVPLPFRILFLVQLGAALWYILTVTMAGPHLKINVMNLLNLSYNSHNYGDLPGSIAAETTPSGEYASMVGADFHENTQLGRGIWSNLIAVSVANTVAWIAFKLLETYIPGRHLGAVPAIAVAYCMYRLFLPLRQKGPQFGQYRAYTTIKRVLLGNINSVSMRSNDILLSDSLISYAKVINDFGLYVWGYYLPTTASYNPLLEVAILAVPTLIRIKQCWFEFRNTGQKQHVANLCKYALGLLPLAINYMIKITLLAESEDKMARVEQLTRWWYVFSSINSTYSLFWDIRMDWGLKMFDKMERPASPWLRSLICYPPWFYVAAIVVDAGLRYVWVLRLFIIEEDPSYLSTVSKFLFGYDAFSFGYTVLEVLEILRRWMWCFIKLESDWVKLQSTDSLELADVKAS